MNKYTTTVHPFISVPCLREIKAFHEYTCEDVSKCSLYELTELGLLIPDYLNPQGWKFSYSWLNGHIKMGGFVKPVGIRPLMFLRPSDEVLATIKARIAAEGYQAFCLHWDYSLSQWCICWDYDEGIHHL